jgi:hypothetical protein
MHRRWLLLGCAGVAWLGACGAGDETLPSACTDRAGVERALARAPDEVTLADGTRLSACLRAATTAADLQTLGATLTAVAADLERDADGDPASAGRLGYLIGASRRGIEGSSGTAAELAHRLERSGAGVSDPASATALRRGLAAGETSG